MTHTWRPSGEGESNTNHPTPIFCPHGGCNSRGERDEKKMSCLSAIAREQATPRGLPQCTDASLARSVIPPVSQSLKSVSQSLSYRDSHSETGHVSLRSLCSRPPRGVDQPSWGLTVRLYRWPSFLLEGVREGGGAGRWQGECQEILIMCFSGQGMGLPALGWIGQSAMALVPPPKPNPPDRGTSSLPVVFLK